MLVGYWCTSDLSFAAYLRLLTSVACKPVHKKSCNTSLRSAPTDPGSATTPAASPQHAIQPTPTPPPLPLPLPPHPRPGPLHLPHIPPAAVEGVWLPLECQLSPFYSFLPWTRCCSLDLPSHATRTPPGPSPAHTPRSRSCWSGTASRHPRIEARRVG